MGDNDNGSAFFLILLVLGGAGVLVVGSQPQQINETFTINGEDIMPLHRDGSQIKDADGNPIILRGICYETDQYHANQMAYIKAMGVNCVEIMIGAWNLGDFATHLAIAEDIAAEATVEGLYVLLRPFSMYGTSLASHGSSYADWISKWDTVASTFSGYTNVIYEPINEYLHWSYANHQTYIHACIDIIRAYSPNALICVSGAGGAGTGDGVSWDNLFSFQTSNPINRDNIFFGCDPYGFFTYPDASQAGIWSSLYIWFDLGAISGYPIVFTEFAGGLSPASGSYGVYEKTWTNNFMATCDSHGSSGYFAFRWIVQGVGETPELSLLSDWSGGLSPFGIDVSAYYNTYDLPVAVAPVFDPVAGTYSTGQNVSLSSATAGASIYYTLDGSTPDSTDTLYTSAIAVGAGSTTILAVAIKSGYANSTIVTAQYLVYLAQYFNVEILTASGGYTSPSGTHTYIVGQTASVTAYPNENYTFRLWLLDGAFYSVDASVSIMGTAGVTYVLQPEFLADTVPTPDPTTWELTITTDGHVSSPVAGHYLIDVLSLLVSAIALPTYKFKNFLVDGALSTTNPITLVAVFGSSHTLHVRSEPDMTADPLNPSTMFRDNIAVLENVDVPTLTEILDRVTEVDV